MKAETIKGQCQACLFVNAKCANDNESNCGFFEEDKETND